MATAIRKPPVISSPVMGMLIFILTELMFFAALMSAFNIVKSGAVNWPPMGQPRLPILTTGFNTALLLASGFTLFASYRLFQKGNSPKIKKLFLVSLILGLSFVVLQGYEWVNLVRFGLTMTSSVYGSFFYLIIGLHGLHVLGATIFLAFLYRSLLESRLTVENFGSGVAFWVFVVGLWPILYILVYFS